MPESTATQTLVLDDGAMRVHLTKIVQMSGGQRSLALRLGVNQREISQAVNGLRPVSKTVAKALGFDRFVEPRRVRYRRRRSQ